MQGLSVRTANHIPRSTMVPRPVPDSPPTALVPEFFAGRSVFITGATGFMGKVLVERLLWTCPDIQQLYLLMRWKKDLAPEKRLTQLKQSKVFDMIRERCPHQLEKLSVVPGDVTLPRLGMEFGQVNRLREVSVVFHSAATLKFNEPLAAAVEQNVRSVISLMDICDQLPNMQVFVHVSTAYCNAELSYVDERVYPTTTGIEQLLALTDSVPQDVLAEITPRLISPKPNTYTFTKAIAESVVSLRGASANYSAAIFRPSIVVSSLRHPFPGWIENLNGPSGVVVGVGKGILHVMSGAGHARADMIPVDIAIDTLIAVAWETGTEESGIVRVYNCSSYEKPTTWGEFRHAMLREVRQHPFDGSMWYPTGIITQSSLLQKVSETAFQTLPLHAIDCVFKLCGFKPRLSMSTASKRLHAMNEALKFFSLREWRFSTDNVQRLRARLSPPDAQIYNLDPNTIDWDEHCVNFVIGTRKYLLREKDQDIASAERRMYKLYIIHKAIVFAMIMLLYRTVVRNTPAILRTVRTLLRRPREHDM